MWNDHRLTEKTKNLTYLQSGPPSSTFPQRLVMTKTLSRRHGSGENSGLCCSTGHFIVRSQSPDKSILMFTVWVVFEIISKLIHTFCKYRDIQGLLPSWNRDILLYILFVLAVFVDYCLGISHALKIGGTATWSRERQIQAYGPGGSWSATSVRGDLPCGPMVWCRWAYGWMNCKVDCWDSRVLGCLEYQTFSK